MRDGASELRLVLRKIVLVTAAAVVRKPMTESECQTNPGAMPRAAIIMTDDGAANSESQNCECKQNIQEELELQPEQPLQ